MLPVLCARPECGHVEAAHDMIRGCREGIYGTAKHGCPCPAFVYPFTIRSAQVGTMVQAPNLSNPRIHREMFQVNRDSVLGVEPKIHAFTYKRDEPRTVVQYDHAMCQVRFDTYDRGGWVRAYAINKSALYGSSLTELNRLYHHVAKSTNNFLNLHVRGPEAEQAVSVLRKATVGPWRGNSLAQVGSTHNCRCTALVPQEKNVSTPTKETLNHLTDRLVEAIAQFKSGAVRLDRATAQATLGAVMLFADQLATAEQRQREDAIKAAGKVFSDGNTSRVVRSWRVREDTVQRKAQPGDVQFIDVVSGTYHTPTQPTILAPVPAEDPVALREDLVSQVAALNAAGLKAYVTTDLTFAQTETRPLFLKLVVSHG